MDALISLASFMAILGVFGVIAAIVGSDSRDGFDVWHGHDHSLTPRFK